MGVIPCRLANRLTHQTDGRKVDHRFDPLYDQQLIDLIDIA